MLPAVNIHRSEDRPASWGSGESHFAPPVGTASGRQSNRSSRSQLLPAINRLFDALAEEDIAQLPVRFLSMQDVADANGLAALDSRTSLGEFPSPPHVSLMTR